MCASGSAGAELLAHMRIFISPTMQIPKAELEKFIALYQKHFGVVLGKDEALEKATKLLNFMRIITETSTEK